MSLQHLGLLKQPIMTKSEAERSGQQGGQLPTCMFWQWNFPAGLHDGLSVRHVFTSSQLKQERWPRTEAIHNNFWQCAMTSLPGQM